MRKIKIIMALILAGLITPAYGYEIWFKESPEIAPLYYYINEMTFSQLTGYNPTQQGQISEAIKLAFDTWSNASDWTAEWWGSNVPVTTTHGNDGINLVSFGNVLASGSALAVCQVWSTTTGYVPEGGTVTSGVIITEVDIELNPDHWWSTLDTEQVTDGVYDIETVMLHEVGHAVGLNDLYTTATYTERPAVKCVADTDANQVTLAGTATTAVISFSSPKGVAFDPTNRYLYVADTGNHRIVKLNDTGTSVKTSWGSQGVANGKFESPEDVATDSSGNVYVVDTGNNRIQKFSSAGGLPLAVWGEHGAGNSKFKSPGGIALDWTTRDYSGSTGSSYNYVYVADTDNHRIQKFDSDGAFLEWWGYDDSDIDDWENRLSDLDNVHTSGDGGYPTDRLGGFNFPEGVAVDAWGNVYVADTGNDRIQKFDSTGKWIYPVISSTDIRDIDVDINGDRYTVSSTDNAWGVAVDVQDQDKVMYAYNRMQRMLTLDEIAGAIHLHGNDEGSSAPPRDPAGPAGGGGGGCFIATAAFGTPLADEVKHLSKFRDEYLLTNRLGTALVDTYYRLSPPIAEKIRENETAKAFVRAALKPLIWFSKKATY